ncbi:hypothetical protein GCM10027062_10400 [Nocardioides hungaricus]
MAGRDSGVTAHRSDAGSVRVNRRAVSCVLHDVLPIGLFPVAAAVMPLVLGLPSSTAGERLGEAGASSSWGGPVLTDCGTRPGTVVRQYPESGKRLRPSTEVRIRTAAIDPRLGPCDRGRGIAGAFYRFAVDPSLGAPFAAGDTWAGIEDGAPGTWLDPVERADPAAWRLPVGYAERGSPTDLLRPLAASGGWYRVRPGVVAGCAFDDGDPPPPLRGLRAITLTPYDPVMSCMDWWGVTLFVEDGRIRGVALRQGSP